MRSWLPSIHWTTGMLCLDDGEAEGPILSFEWLGLFVEVHFYRRTRWVD
jgi:hypothetical protein